MNHTKLRRKEWPMDWGENKYDILYSLRYISFTKLVMQQWRFSFYLWRSDLKTPGWSIKAIRHAELCRPPTSDPPGHWFFAGNGLHHESSVRSMQISWGDVASNRGTTFWDREDLFRCSRHNKVSSKRIYSGRTKFQVKGFF
jgi:hypothetical protein